MALKIYRKQEAVKAFKGKGLRYRSYDPMRLIVGTRKEIAEGITISIHLNGEPLVENERMSYYQIARLPQFDGAAFAPEGLNRKVHLCLFDPDKDEAPVRYCKCGVMLAPADKTKCWDCSDND